jgi:hypothetical protein
MSIFFQNILIVTQPLGVNVINILLAHFAPIFWCQKLQSWNIIRENCAKHFRTKNAQIKCWWNWHLEVMGVRMTEFSHPISSFHFKNDLFLKSLRWLTKHSLQCGNGKWQNCFKEIVIYILNSIQGCKCDREWCEWCNIWDAGTEKAAAAAAWAAAAAAAAAWWWWWKPAMKFIIFKKWLPVQFLYSNFTWSRLVELKNYQINCCHRDRSYSCCNYFANVQMLSCIW